MEKAKKMIEIHKNAFSRIYDEVKKQIEAERYDNLRILSNMKVLDEKMTSINELNQLLMDMMLSSDDIGIEIIDEEVQKWDKMSTEYHELKLKVDKLQSLLQPSISNTTSVYSDVKKTRKLPVIEFRKFGGDLKDWLSFWSQFRRIDEDSDIENEDKFGYLIQSTVPNSRARQLVESYPQTCENYPKVIHSLKQRFGRQDLLVEVYVRELLKLILNNNNNNKKIKLSSFYDKIESQLRALETLGVTSDTCAAMLYPLVESCIGEDLIRVWQRSSYFTEDVTMKKRLDQLIVFLRKEVENEDRITLAVSGFENIQEKQEKRQVLAIDKRDKVHTAADLVNKNILKCIFCSGDHFTDNCTQASSWSFEKKKEKLTHQGCCYLCLRFGHIARRCRAKLSCKKCRGRHSTIMCAKNQKAPEQTEKNAAVTEHIEQNLSNQTYTEVFLQTMLVQLKGNNKTRTARLLIDTGSQKSYITKDVAIEMGYQPIKREKLIHSLFGGLQTKTISHNCYKIHLSSLSNDYACNFEVMDQPIICNNLVCIKEGPWFTELKKVGIEITDKHDGPIEILVGADVAGKLMTGNKHQLKCGLVALHTLLGWTLMGKINTPVENEVSSLSMLTTNLFTQNTSVSKLWDLDVIGIGDPIERKKSEENERDVMDYFLTTVKRNEDGRYQVSMPWVEGHPPLPTNFHIAEKRLKSSTRKLRNDGYYEKYNEVFDSWLKEGIIEEISKDTSFENTVDAGHFLTHHPVYNFQSSTTPIRPVFNASLKQKDQPSLNDCLEKGMNLIELIPSVLFRFRLQKIGVIADIRKAFLQIELAENDRDFVKFLWYDEEKELIIFRHTRVVFGINCSPFLLGAVLEYHFNNTNSGNIDEKYPLEVIEKLSKSFYVDNVVTSVDDTESLEDFMKISQTVLAEGKFDLRGWEQTIFDENISDLEQNLSNVLGLTWNRNEDTLHLSLKWFENFDTRRITKRTILSAAHKLYDPIGFCCPVALIPKCLLQKLWNLNIGWDIDMDDEIRDWFLRWLQEIPFLRMVKIPRWISPTTDISSRSIHVFCDASEAAYATCIFLRSEDEKETYVRLIEAKSRVAPTKKNKNFTIPRLELLAATIGVRLAQNTLQNINAEIKMYYWTDSTTVLSWIKRENQWKPFIWNRVQEIRNISNPDNWFYVPGELNCADLPSRGCSAKKLVDQKWWEGPRWLYEPISRWPSQHFVCDEEEINIEKRKTVVSSLLATEKDDQSWYYRFSSKFSKIVYVIGWMRRFISNSRKIDKVKNRCEIYLTVMEIKEAEKIIIKLIQEESFGTEENSKLASLCAFKDDEGLIRIRTKISDREDNINFRFPYVLPSKHVVVRRLIMHEHIINCHVGIQGMISLLRERFWILRCRRTVKSVLSKCIVCQRFIGKPVESTPICLPEDRVRQAAAFEITGIDLAGPLYLKTGEKVWICLYTCAVYRAVHLELLSSLSTSVFMQSLRRFISRRGRPATIYTDNGTNFVGCENDLKRLDWAGIMKETSIKKIEWNFIPPTAAWWGGWWERLIRMMKDILKKVLGKACLQYEELSTILCDCEALLNARPLTYLSEDAEELAVLTPSMFIQEIRECGIPDINAVEASDLRKHQKYIFKLRSCLLKRFRSEYLGNLQLFSKRQNPKSVLNIGEIVLIADYNVKNINWPLGKVVALIPGRDGNARIARIKTKHGEFLRPVQRLLRLEMEKENLPEDTVRRARDFKNPIPTPADSAGVSAQGDGTPALDENSSISDDSVPGSHDGPDDVNGEVPDISENQPITRYGRRIKKPQRYED